MCVDNDSRPPLAPIAGGSMDARDFRLTSSDGTKFMAYAARSTRPTGAGMVVIPGELVRARRSGTSRSSSGSS